ncbi:MAG: AraC family transcriptional regulator [Actinomycetota bacterium]
MEPIGPETKAFDPLPLYVGHVSWAEPSSPPHVTNPHRHPHPELCVVQGSAVLVVDAVEVEIVGPCAFVIAPGRVHTWTISDPFELWVVGLKPGVVDGDGLIARLADAPVPIPDDEFADLLGLLRLARRRFEEQPDRPTRAADLVGSLTRLLGEWSTAPALAGRPDDVVDAFVAAVEQTHGRRIAVGTVARELGVSAGHLADRVSARLGRSPREIIDQHSHAEACRRLTAGASAASVAAGLGFADASQFGRWFKRHAGVTPGEFRTSSRPDPGEG